METISGLVFIGLVSGASCFLTDTDNSRGHYAMYVWRTGFDPSVHGCDQTDFLDWDSKHSHCFTHTWNSPEKRQWLWDTCNLSGREISSIFLADVYHKVKAGFLANDCDSSDITLLRTTLTEGHISVTNLKIYALFAASDIEVSERHMVPYVVWYNDNCARESSCLVYIMQLKHNKQTSKHWHNCSLCLFHYKKSNNICEKEVIYSCDM